MTPRGIGAARICLVGFLASAGALAVPIWMIATWATDVSVGPQHDSPPISPTLPGLNATEHLIMARANFRWSISVEAAAAGWAVLVYWLLAYLLGAARVRPAAHWFRAPGVWLAAAIAVGLARAYLAAAPVILTAPMSDACLARYRAAHPNALEGSGPSHECIYWAYWIVGGWGFLLVVVLLIASLWLRLRAREAAAPR